MPSNKNKIPITRVNKFYSDEDFKFDIELGREFIEGDLNMSVILYRVDRNLSNVDSLYGEVTRSELKFLPPVEVTGSVRIEVPENKTYSKGKLNYMEHGKLTLLVYQDHLDELGVDISYGDYIGYAEDEFNVQYFTVVNDGRVKSDTQHTIIGYKGFYRTITCSPVQQDEFLF